MRNQNETIHNGSVIYKPTITKKDAVPVSKTNMQAQTRQAKKLTYLDFLSPASDKAGYTKEWKKQPPVYRKQTKAQIKAGAKKSVQIPASWYISYTPISKYEKAQKTAELFQRKWKYKTAELIA